MLTLKCPAKYRRYVLAALGIALADVGRDVACREDDDERVRGYAPVKDELIGTEEGTLTIVVGVEENDSAVTALLLTAGATV